MAGTKTGKGGFEIGGKVYDFDTGDPNAIGEDQGNPDHGDINVDNKKKDVSKTTKKTLKQYLSDSTMGKEGFAKGKPNAFPIAPPGDLNQPDSTISAPDGNPASFSETTNDRQYVKRSDIVTGYSDIPDAKLPGGPRSFTPAHEDPATTLGGLAKGKQGKSNDGNNLLKGVSKNSLPPIIEAYQKTVLTANRFTANSQDFDPTKPLSELPGQDKYRIGGKDYSLQQLKQVGVMLSLRGSQEFPAAFDDNVNPVNAGSVAGAILPSPNQLGILKIPNRLLEARDALEHLSNNTDEPAELDIAPLGNQSWGALNNVEEPWAGLLNLGMVAMALAMQVALILAFELLGMLFSIGSGADTPTQGKLPAGRYVLGRSTTNPLPDPSNIGFPPNITALLGIRGTRYPFGDALKVGSKAFFVGAEKAKEGTGAALLGSLASAATNALSDNSNAGFVIIVSRLIIRTGQTIAADISKIGKAFASNPLSGAKSIIGLLDNMRHSKLIAAMNIFAMLGDAILSEDLFAAATGEKSLEKGMHSTVDAYDDNIPGAAARKNRLKNVEGGSATKLAWAANRSPSMYLLPSSMIGLSSFGASKFGGFLGPLGTNDKASNSTVIATKKEARLSSKDVAKVENALNGEYVPFYFHDLRTNEIVGFHAFLTSLSDDYTANYESIDGYGRVDPVKIYKNTARKIGMSFYIAATSPEDFNDMWLKINKLTTLLYPQYTKGRTLTDGSTTSFTQPFSQLIGASPLIRIRLGDLFRSNYSRFALARLFGAADNDMKLEGSDIKSEGDLDGKSINELTTKAIESQTGKFFLSSTGWPSAPKKSGGFGIPIPIVSGPSAPKNAQVMTIDAGDLQYFEFEVTGFKIDKTAVVKANIRKQEDLAKIMSATTAGSLVDMLEAKYNNNEDPTRKIKDASYAVPISALSLTPESIQSQLKKFEPTNANLLSDFLKPENNALVKSFKDVQGKGLAGVIESMNFDWYAGVSWETDPTKSRAPKMCKVTLTFSPIHDISPGIDHLGYNRAPIYPVGTTMGQNSDDSDEK